MRAKLLYAALGALAAAAAGCATFSTISLVTNSFNTAVVTRAISVLPPASEQKVTAFLIWNPLGGNVSAITRTNKGTLPATYSFRPSEFTPSGPLLADSSVSAGVKYLYTLKVGEATRGNTIEPVASVVEQATQSSPGIGLLEFEAKKQTALPAAAIVGGGKPTFVWDKLRNKDASQSYGYFIVVGQFNKDSQTGLDATYSAFLDEASHSTGVDYGTQSDLEGFGTDLLNHLKGVEALKFLSPVDASSSGMPESLPPGDYGWTVLVVNADSRLVAFGIGKMSPPTDSKHFKFFRVP